MSRGRREVTPASSALRARARTILDPFLRAGVGGFGCRGSWAGFLAGDARAAMNRAPRGRGALVWRNGGAMCGVGVCARESWARRARRLANVL